jgi:hypothetical protein
MELRYELYVLKSYSFNKLAVMQMFIQNYKSTSVFTD